MTDAQYIDITSDGGLKKKILKEGTTSADDDVTPPNGAEVTVHYVGRLASDGSQFDSSRDRDEPFKFKLGAGSVIKGWDLGVATMKLGELAELRIRADYGYGASGSPPKIPGNAELVFEVELLSWNAWEEVGPKKNKAALLKQTISEDKESGWQKPKVSTRVKVNYVLKVLPSKEVVETKSKFCFTIGDAEVIRGLEKIVMTMKKGEKSRFKVHPSLGYGSTGNAALNIPPNAELLYEIELVEFRLEKERWDMNAKEKLEFSDKKRQSGNTFFKQGNFAIAKKKYKAAMELVENDHDFEDDENKRLAKKARLVIILNMAAVLLKLNKFRDTLSYCEKALKLEAKNLKALFRRGQAYRYLADYENAKKDIKLCLSLEPDNKEIKAEYSILMQLAKQQDKKEKKLASKMFAGISRDDNEPKTEAPKESPKAENASITVEEPKKEW